MPLWAAVDYRIYTHNVRIALLFRALPRKKPATAGNSIGVDKPVGLVERELLLVPQGAFPGAG
jgi:hypothetical protein